MASLNRNLLTSFTKAAQDAAHTYANYTDTANQEMVATKTAALRNEVLPQVRDIVTNTTKPSDRAQLTKAIGVDWADPASVNAVPIKWDQVQQLLAAGQTWASIIDQADLPTLAAIVENAPTYLQTEAAKPSDRGDLSFTRNAQGVSVDTIDLMAAQRAAQLGHTPAKSYLNNRAQDAYNHVVASKITRQLEEQRDLSTIAMQAELWDREAETKAARVKGEPTPNERDLAAHQAQRAQEFQAVSGESPDELAAKVPRSY